MVGACVQKVPVSESAIQPSHPRAAHHANLIAWKTLQLCFGHDSFSVFDATSCQKSEPQSQTPFKLSPFLNPRQTNGSKASRERNTWPSSTASSLHFLLPSSALKRERSVFKKNIKDFPIILTAQAF